MSVSTKLNLLASTSLLGMLATTAAVAQTTSVPAGTTVLSPVVVQSPSEPAPRSVQRQSSQSDSSPSSAPRPASSQPAAQPTSAPSATPSALDALTTSSEKQAAQIYDAPGIITVKSTAEIERQTANTPAQLIRDEPGVNFGNQPLRGGGTNYVIRGVDGNRIRVEIDGVKMPDFPGTNIGSPTGYTRDFVDLDMVKRVEIVRGAASALYGSDAIGGVVSYVTKDPSDYLALVGKDWFASVKGGFDTADRSIFTTLTGATRFGDWEQMVVATRRWGHEVTPNGKLDPNPQSYMTSNVLGKVVWNGPNTSQLKLTGEIFERNVSTTLNSEVGFFPSTFGTVFASLGDDTNRRGRFTGEWTSPVSWFFADAIKIKGSYTEATREELSSFLRATCPPGCLPATTPTRLRLSDFDYDQSIVSGEMQFTAARKFWGGEHVFTYGFTVDQTDTTRPRHRTEQNLITGVVTTSVGGELFPNKNFPDTTTTMGAIYIQDVAQWGAFRLIPAVRFDVYDLKVHPDQLFANSQTAAVSDMTATAVSPKLGATYDLTKELRVFGQYSHGFRAPPYDNANFGFKNTTSFYEILPNGNLVPETVDGFEVGLRGRNAQGSSFQVSAYYNAYQNFIDTVVVKQAVPPGVTQYQYQNIPEATIWGIEAKGEWRFEPKWTLFGSVAYANGTNESTGRPIDSVDPLKAIGGLRYKGTDGWSGEVRTTWVAEKDRVSAPGILQVPSHTTVDMLAGYEVAPSMTINAGVFNIFNESYFNPTDVAGVAASNPLLELYRAPGRTGSMNVTFRW